MAKVTVDTKSRNVKRYVRAVVERNRLRRDLVEADRAVFVAYSSLRGGRLSEVRKILTSMQESER